MPGVRRVVILCLIAAVGCCAAPGVAHAQQTTMQVRLGWDGRVHADRWNPAFVTLSDPRPRNVVLEFHTPYDSFNGMRVVQAMTIGPQAQTFPLFLPVRGMNLEDVSVVVRDATTEKKLASLPSATTALRGGVMTDPAKAFIGVSGRPATLRSVIDGLPGAMLETGHLDPADLPADAIGYDCLDVLVLNSPNLSALTAEQQQAIADWVRSGGNLVLWPSDDPVPTEGPLLEILPCQVGQSLVTELPPDVLAQAGLTPRFGKLPARELTPLPGAEPVRLLGSDRVTAYRRRAGFGRVLVCPTDLSAFIFNDPKNAWRLWKPVLEGMVRRLPEDAVTPPERYYGIDEAAVREASAVRQLGDLLGNVPGAGRFGFGYVAGILIGMMVVVGPLDWFVLKRLGRQPWTWATTGGWIGLVTLSALYAGHLLKSGDLHFRTFQLIDQADGAAVARTDLAGLYSPRTRAYDVQMPADSWWQPVAPGDEYYVYRATAGRELSFHQTYRGNQPEPMIVNVWNLRFVKGRAGGKAAGPALVDAALQVVTARSGDRTDRRLVGTVTNLGPTAMKNLAVRTKDGICVFSQRAPAANQVQPGQTVTVDAIIDAEMRPSPESDPNNPRFRGSYYGGYAGNTQVPPLDPARPWDVGGYLAVRRGDQVGRLLDERTDLACVLAECENPDPVARLNGLPAIEQHWKVVRALVPLKGPAGPARQNP